MKGKKPARPNARVPAQRPPWWGRLWIGAKAGLGLVLVVGTAGATAWGGYRLALTSPRFSVQKIEVEASRRLTEREVARRAGVEPGASLLGLDLRAAEQRLLTDPWVQSARITRKLPHTLRIQMQEHEALALASLDGEIFLVDAEGEPFKVWQE
ncbi:MAG TPA: FtsQ-type POTRA domain-containing protein, partial [Polyangiaceae bacterium]|nr:FtsQ-type POTRA domain-containing protein [Polyangiaceae bacterium]